MSGTITRTLHREAELQRRHFRFYKKLKSSEPARKINVMKWGLIFLGYAATAIGIWELSKAF